MDTQKIKPGCFSAMLRL
uniref:Uncharacterized protein n=1 Tax=Anguilla anguilla TaxID=7936 RepID=A0A0E9QI51_ANGAN